MTNVAQFFKMARAGKLLGPTLSQSEVDGCSAIIAAMDGLPLPCVAYAMATAYKETAHSMHPVEEAGWLSLDARNKYFFRMYDIHGNRPAIATQLGNLQPGDGVRYHGRDYVQTTGRKNYRKAGLRIGVDLEGSPERIAELPNAAKVMRFGMAEGWFTTHKLADYFTTPVGTVDQFTRARAIINGHDCDAEIAEYALEFQEYLR